MQRVLWASQLRHPDSPHQNMALLSRVHGEVDGNRLAKAFAAVVAASDVLRTTIIDTEDGPVVSLSAAPATTEILSMTVADAIEWARERVRLSRST